MKALILAAGKGTRMLELGKNTPKALFKVNGKYVLDRIIEYISKTEIRQVYIITNNYFYPKFKEWYDNQKSELEIKLLNNGIGENDRVLGWAADLEFGARNINEDLLVMSSDNLYDPPIDLNNIIKFFYSKNTPVILGVYYEKDGEKLKKTGVVKFDEKNKIIDFFEKPQTKEDIDSNWAHPLLQIYPEEYLSKNEFGKYLEENLNHDTNPSRWNFNQKRFPMYAWEMDCKRFDIGSPKSLNKAREYFEKHNL